MDQHALVEHVRRLREMRRQLDIEQGTWNVHHCARHAQSLHVYKYEYVHII